MWEAIKPIYPAGPCNRTDPQMLHDNRYTPEPIVTQHREQYNLASNADEGQPDDNTRHDAIFYPLIRVNNHLIGEEQIIKFVFHNDRFMPYIDLVFEDTYDTVEFGDMPGLNNVIAVVMLEGIPDAHKPIKMNFYITSCEVVEHTFYIQAEFKCLPLEEEQLKQEVFYWPSAGCSYCGLGPRFYPTTFELLHVIADNCGLGFGATQYTKEIEDIRYRILKRQKYKDVIQDAVACGGINEDNMFDAWIDPWENLIMANVSWEFSEAVTPDELATMATTGVETADGLTTDTKKDIGWCHRILSNISTVTGYNNLMITEIKKMVDLHSGYYDGTLTDYNTIYPEGVKLPEGDPAHNDLRLQQVQERENSLTGHSTDEFRYDANNFAGFDMAELTKTVAQRQRHDEYFRKLRSKIYRVTMLEPNFGLERGMLTFVQWFVADNTQKSTVLYWRENLHVDESGEPQKYHDLGETDMLDDEYSMVLDVAVSGIYYIDGTDFEWDPDNGKIQQHLYLIKRNSLNEYYNKANTSRYREPYKD